MSRTMMLLLTCFTALVGCSEMETHPTVTSAQPLKEAEPFAVMVQTGSDVAPIVYEYAVEELGKSFRIVENGPAKGRIEITFSSSTQSAFFGSSTGYTTGSFNSSGWYSGNRTYYSGQLSATTTGISSGGTFDWQNSTMIVVIRDEAGNRLYSADYKYKGGWELSGFVVNTPAEAAKLCIERIHKKLVADLHL